MLNSGSSSLKFKLFDVAKSGGLAAVAWGLCERIGDTAHSRLKASARIEGATNTLTADEAMRDHTSALKLATDFLADQFSHSFVSEVHSVGHRVVHGLTYSNPVRIE